MDRRRFLRQAGAGLAGVSLQGVLRRSAIAAKQDSDAAALPRGWVDPAREFSPAPFWFWNDDLSEAEIVRQMADFREHGVYGFVIHARAGLPRSIAWLSERMIHFMRVAIEEAAKTGMFVILYDEGMYPSGSSSGQVVAENPAYRTRGLFQVDLDALGPGAEKYGIKIASHGGLALTDNLNLVATVKRKTNGHRIAVVDRAIRPGYSVIRGLHFVDPDAKRRANHKEVPENTPPAGDILNPKAVRCFIRLVYQKYYNEFGGHFGRTVKAIFTDEPSFFAKRAERGAVPGTTGIVQEVNRILGYDFTPHLPTLWYKDEPQAERYRRDYNRALQRRLEETFYGQIRRWCDAHGIALTGHPAKPDDIGHLRHFHMPGQDIVWRYIQPGKPSALEGAQSTQAKCASSAMIHLKRRRNLNEYCGAYGQNFTFDEMKWLTHWLVVRGCNLLVPHAFYYSIRGPRVDERPPDVGPNSAWWDQYRPFADACRRLCWLNTNSKHICDIAILGMNDYLPWEAAKVCQQNQWDFNYLEARHLWEDAKVNRRGIDIAGMHYAALIVEFDPPAEAKDALQVLGRRLIRWTKDDDAETLLRQVNELVRQDAKIMPACSDLRVRHVTKDNAEYYILFNEGDSSIEFTMETSAKWRRTLLDPSSEKQDAGASPALQVLQDDEVLKLERHALRVLRIQ